MRSNIPKLIGRIAREAAKREVVQATTVNGERILESVGTGIIPDDGGGLGIATLIQKEIVTWYSTIIITADGAFEKPTGWPTDGSYTEFAQFSGATLPDSLSMVGGTLTLDVDVDHYEQRRVHASYFYDGNAVSGFKYHVPLEEPYTSVYLSGLDANTDDYDMLIYVSVLPEFVGTDIAIALGAG
jgi:hypothetical protein